MNNTNDKRAAFQDFRDQRNKELAANGLDDQSNFWITNAHYTAWCRGIEWQSQQAQGEAVADGIEAAAAWVDARAHAYVEEHGSYDPDTGTTEFAGDGADYLLELEEIAEGIRSLAPPAPAAMPELTPEMIEAGANAVMITDSAAECAEKVYRAMRAVAPQPAEQQPVHQGVSEETISAVISLVKDAAAAHLNSEFNSCLSKIRKLLYHPQPEGDGCVPDVAGLVEALEPFAACADELDGYPADGVEPSDDNEWASFRLLVSDYRRARTALAAYRKGGE